MQIRYRLLLLSGGLLPLLPHKNPLFVLDCVFLDHEIYKMIIMKTKIHFVLFLMMLFQFSMDAVAQTTTRNITIHARRMQSSHRSMPVCPTATLSGKVVTIDFPAAVSSVTVVVKNTATGEVVYSSTHWAATQVIVDLSAEEAGAYTLEIQESSEIFVGDFDI